jgi:large subunit ribosomal protein L21
MYAVIETGGKQYRVTDGQKLTIEKLPNAEGEDIVFDKVLMLSDDAGLKIGTPYLNVQVRAKVLLQGRGEKVRIVKHRRRKHYHREMGHRQYVTEVQIIDAVNQ